MYVNHDSMSLKQAPSMFIIDQSDAIVSWDINQRLIDRYFDQNPHKTILFIMVLGCSNHMTILRNRDFLDANRQLQNCTRNKKQETRWNQINFSCIKWNCVGWSSSCFWKYTARLEFSGFSNGRVRCRLQYCCRSTFFLVTILLNFSRFQIYIFYWSILI